MNKLKDNLFELFLCLFSLRSFIVGPTFSDAMIAICLIISIVYTKNYLKKGALSENDAMVKEFDLIKQEIAKIKLDQGIKKIGTSGFRS